MSNMDANNIQNLVKQIEALKKTVESADEEVRIKLEDINIEDVLKEIPFTPEGKLDAKKWGSLGELGQRERYSKLNCILDALKAVADSVTPLPTKQPCGYGAALIATLIFLPGAATFFTVIFMLIPESHTSFFHMLLFGSPANYSFAPVWGTLSAILACLMLSPFCHSVADAKHAIPSSYSELLPRLDELEVNLKGFNRPKHLPVNPCKNSAYHEAKRECEEIRKDLAMKGLSWLLASEYSKVWGRLYRAEEALIEVAPKEKVLKGAYYDESRLEGSGISNRDDLLAKLRKAVVSIDPCAQKYLMSTAAITAPPVPAVGTTALPGGMVAVDYCAHLFATGGVPPYKWAVIGGAIPDGLVLSATCVLRGTPTSDGHGNFTIQVTDSAGVAVEKYFDLLISPQTQTAPLAISTTSPLPWGTVDDEYTERLFAIGGKPPYEWTIIGGTIPVGMTLSKEGVLHGKPDSAGTFKFKAEVTVNSGISPSERDFTLLIKPSGAAVAEPIGDTEPERLARAVLRHVRNSINEYRNVRWGGLILARNRLLATTMLTGMILFALLAIAIMSGAKGPTINAATVFFLVGATAGLGNRLRSASQAESAFADYGLSAARLITVPLFSGLGAIGGLMFVAYLPFATPQFAPSLSDTPQTMSTPSPNVPEKDAPKRTAPATGTDEKAASKTSAQKTSAVDKASPNKNTPPPRPKLEDIFDFNKNLIGLFVAAVFGLTPGLLFDRMQQQADKYKADLKSSQSTEGAQKSEGK